MNINEILENISNIVENNKSDNIDDINNGIKKYLNKLFVTNKIGNNVKELFENEFDRFKYVEDIYFVFTSKEFYNEYKIKKHLDNK